MTGSELHLDFETRSTVNLKTAGLYAYAEHPTTDVWCACWAIDDGEVESWVLGDPVPETLMKAVRDGVKIIAHNAGFEWVIWNLIMVPRHGWTPFPFDQMECTAAMASAMALPRDLGRAAGAMGLAQQKDDKGKRIMLQLCKPRRYEADGSPVWWTDETKHAILLEYCKQDVRTERALHKKLRPLSAFERTVWLLDHLINSRGVRIDVNAVRRAHRIVRDALAKLDAELRAITAGALTTVTKPGAMLDWLHGRGYHLDKLDKEAVADALRCELDPLSRRVLEIRQEGAKSSTAKLDAMLARLSQDGRSRETLMYHAAGTGRWGGKGIQLQNLPRPDMEPEDVLLAFEALMRGDGSMLGLFGSAPSVVSSMLRGMVCAAPGYELIRGDYSNIEGRVLAWLAGEEWKLQAFRDFDAKRGPDIYLIAAAAIYGVDVATLNKKSPERQIGKVSELACGFGGGKGAYISMGRVYGVYVEEDRAEEIKTAWREKHPATVKLWAALDWAAQAAIREPGKVFDYGMVRVGDWRDDEWERVPLKVSYGVSGNILWCKLPSGRLLSYPAPRLQMMPVPWGGEKLTVTYMAMNDKNQWVRVKGYGGHWAENITQAVARDIMAEALVRIEGRGWSVVLSVHDEAVSEVLKGTVTVAEYEAEMEVRPVWGEEIPITSEGDVGERYGK